MGAHQIRVWTYWEGPRNALVDICEHSIQKTMGNLWVPITDKNTGDWIEMPEEVANHPNVRTKSDYVRIALLLEYGGIWMDSDVILRRDITEFLGNHPVAWREDQSTRKKLQGLSPGIMVFPFPGHPFLRECLRLFRERLSPNMSPMALYHSAWTKKGQDIRIEDWRDFYHITCWDWMRFWREPALLDLDVVGLHLWASAVKPKTARFQHMQTVESIVKNQPASVLAEYARRYLARPGV